MQVQIETFTVNKRFPLTISRGTTAQTTNIWIRLQHEGIEGWGEASPFSIGDKRQWTEDIVASLEQARGILEPFSPLERQAVEAKLREAEILSAARCAIDCAMFDWMGKRASLPVWRMLGLGENRIVPTSVTIGINPPEVARQRVRDWLGLTGAKSLKVKLGNPAGIEADKEMMLAIRDEAPAEIMLRVDANGGWNLQDAIIMCSWLANVGVEYVEQPLARGREEELPELYRHSPLPLFVDESCFDTRDIIRLAECVHGVNIKLMKCAGITEAIRMVHTAKACGLQVMYGCYSDSTLAISAATQIAPLANHLDLDSQLNLVDDPFTGAVLQDGRVLPNDLPGLGCGRK
jgi:L-alanine-DL-glutamate epimerase-like enolase superfamily enzyme